MYRLKSGLRVLEFQDLLRSYITTEYQIRGLAALCECSQPTICRWLKGTSKPVPSIQAMVLKNLKDKTWNTSVIP